MFFIANGRQPEGKVQCYQMCGTVIFCGDFIFGIVISFVFFTFSFPIKVLGVVESEDLVCSSAPQLIWGNKLRGKQVFGTNVMAESAEVFENLWACGGNTQVRVFLSKSLM